MPWCGFNEKMLEGLTALNEGLVEHGLINRSKKKDQSVEQTLKAELNDMRRFLNETHMIEDPQKRKITEFLTNYALAFYQFIGTQGIENYKEIAQGISKYFRNMDNKFYSELEGKPDDMKQLALYLNKINLGEK